MAVLTALPLKAAIGTDAGGVAVGFGVGVFPLATTVLIGILAQHVTGGFLIEVAARQQ